MLMENKKVIITAAASGMGAAGVEAFTKAGAHVVAVDLNGDNLDKLAATIRAGGGKVDTLTADLLDEQQCRDVVEKAVEIMGGLDALWCHAGMPGRKGIEDDAFDVEAYDRCMDLNVKASLLSTSAAIKHLRKTGGSIVYTASIAGLKGATVSPVYSAAKFAVVGMARSMAQCLAKDGIRANAVCPGPVETPMLPFFMDPDAGADQAKEAEKRIRGAVPLGRVGQPMEIAQAALFLASDAASFVNGVALPVDGAMIA